MRSREDILQKKWQRLLQHRRFFHLIPFIDFVLVSGSMALGTAREESDFDVIVGARTGRIFTVRFFCVVVFELAGVRRARADHRGNVKDKVCFNHFVAPGGYVLASPRNEYSEVMYRNLVPLYGDKQKISKFVKANVWVRRSRKVDYARHLIGRLNLVSRVLMIALGGRAGDAIERTLKRYQIHRIAKYKRRLGDSLHIICTDDVIQFHPMHKHISTGSVSD
ncbi:MAG TPA: hypothetical protein ENH86_02340 [Candidatus Jorgensenbacteria bacterium]|nr:hypothetical protein [Candidatus Jorgensenbacteria bacterium]